MFQLMHAARCVSHLEMNNSAKEADLSNSGDSQINLSRFIAKSMMKTMVLVLWIWQLSVVQDASFFGMEQFDTKFKIGA